MPPIETQWDVRLRRDSPAGRALRHHARRPRRAAPELRVPCNHHGLGGGQPLTGFVFFDIWPLQIKGLAVALVGLALVGSWVLLSDMAAEWRKVVRLQDPP